MSKEETTGIESVEGSTVQHWIRYLEKKKGTEFVEQIINDLAPSSKEEFTFLSKTMTYSRNAFDDLCAEIIKKLDGPAFGIDLGVNSAKSSERIIKPIIKSAKGNPDYFLRERFRSLQKLYIENGRISYSRINEKSGQVYFGGFTHNELECYSNAGYLKRCLQMLNLSDVAVTDLKHSSDCSQDCSIIVSWKSAFKIREK